MIMIIIVTKIWIIIIIITTITIIHYIIPNPCSIHLGCPSVDSSVMLHCSDEGEHPQWGSKVKA